MKRMWSIVLPGRKPFVMILMDETEDALTVARSIWPDAEVR